MSFLDDVEKGRKAEEYTAKWLNRILDKYTITTITPMQKKYIEGMDYLVYVTGFSKEKQPLEADELSRIAGLPDLAYVQEIILVGGMEVKAIGHGSGMQFSNRVLPDNELSLPFELWSNIDRIAPGWLYQFMYPDEERSRRQVEPVLLIYIYKYNEIPFASIVFEDIPCLLERLNELSNHYLWPVWRIPLEDTRKNFQSRRNEIAGNCWRVPFSKVSDLATVTMIGDEPDLIAKGRCSREIQQERLAALYEAAKGRHVELEIDESGFTDTFLAKVLGAIDPERRA